MYFASSPIPAKIKETEKKENYSLLLATFFLVEHPQNVCAHYRWKDNIVKNPRPP